MTPRTPPVSWQSLSGAGFEIQGSQTLPSLIPLDLMHFYQLDSQLVLCPLGLEEGKCIWFSLYYFMSFHIMCLSILYHFSPWIRKVEIKTNFFSNFITSSELRKSKAIWSYMIFLFSSSPQTFLELFNSVTDPCLCWDWKFMYCYFFLSQSFLLSS